MNHPNEGNPEDTSEKLEESSGEIKKEPGGIETPREMGRKEAPKEEAEEGKAEAESDTKFIVDEGGDILQDSEEEEVSEEPQEWTCDICDEPRIGDAYKIPGYHELICGQCYDRGLMWSIREAWKWRSQVRIDVLRKPREDE